MRVLIVDDDSVDRETVKRALSTGSVATKLVEAQTVNEGLAYMRDFDFDLVLVNSELFRRDSIELLDVSKGSEKKRAAIAVMSHLDEGHLDLDPLQAGAQDFILKSEISTQRVRRIIVNAQAKFDLELQLGDAQNRLKHLAERDALTGLANRYLLDETLKIAIANNRRAQCKLALLVIDLDNFKYVNDNLGHDIGDILLKRVVQRINSCLRGNEMFARLGGDEFAILLTNLNESQEASKVAQRILFVLEKPFEINEQSFSSSASIGIAVHPNSGATPDVLLKNADIAMYKAKKLGRHQACFFESEMQMQYSSRYELEQELRDALQKNQFSLVFQPIYEALSHQLGGFEALLRWSDQSGTRAINSYLDIAEESKLILQIGRWVIERAIFQQTKWCGYAGTNYDMHINLSPAQLSDKLLLPMLKKLFLKYDADPKFFVFELTENALLGKKESAFAAIQSLRELGCKVALDDFGVGACSVASLRDFPFDLIKVDPGVLPNTYATDQDKKLFSSIVYMMQALDFKTAVIGTETVEQIELCCRLRVDLLQGHFFLKAESPDYIEENLLPRAKRP